MDHYLFTARSITHAQQMARTLERSGIHVKVRRIGSGVTRSGCGYTLEVGERHYAAASEQLRRDGPRPVKVFLVSGGTTSEIAL